MFVSRRSADRLRGLSAALGAVLCGPLAIARRFHLSPGVPPPRPSNRSSYVLVWSRLVWSGLVWSGLVYGRTALPWKSPASPVKSAPFLQFETETRFWTIRFVDRPQTNHFNEIPCTLLCSNRSKVRNRRHDVP